MANYHPPPSQTTFSFQRYPEVVFVSTMFSFPALLILKRILSRSPVNTGTGFPNKLLLMSELLSHQDFLILNSTCALSNKLVDPYPGTTLITNKAFKAVDTCFITYRTYLWQDCKNPIRVLYLLLIKQALSGTAYRHSPFQRWPN